MKKVGSSMRAIGHAMGQFIGLIPVGAGGAVLPVASKQAHGSGKPWKRAKGKKAARRG